MLSSSFPPPAPRPVACLWFGIFFWLRALYKTCFDCLLPVCGLPSHFLNVSFDEQKFLILMKSDLSVLFFKDGVFLCPFNEFFAKPRGSQPRAVCPSEDRDIFGSHSWARDAAKPATPRPFPTTKNHLARNVRSAEVGKAWSGTGSWRCSWRLLLEVLPLHLSHLSLWAVSLQLMCMEWEEIEKNLDSSTSVPLAFYLKQNSVH